MRRRDDDSSTSPLARYLLCTPPDRLSLQRSLMIWETSDGKDILIEDGVISAVGPSGSLVDEYDAHVHMPGPQPLDVGTRAIVPGLIDAHILIW